MDACPVTTKGNQGHLKEILIPAHDRLPICGMESAGIIFNFPRSARPEHFSNVWFNVTKPLNLVEAEP
jgi:hypothetical protein